MRLVFPFGLKENLFQNFPVDFALSYLPQVDHTPTSLHDVLGKCVLGRRTQNGCHRFHQSLSVLGLEGGRRRGPTWGCRHCGLGWHLGICGSKKLPGELKAPDVRPAAGSSHGVSAEVGPIVAWMEVVVLLGQSRPLGRAKSAQNCVGKPCCRTC